MNHGHVPIINISVEGMRIDIKQALEAHNHEIEQQVAKELESIDIAALVRREVEKQCDYYVKYCVEQAIAKAVGRAITSQETWDVLTLFIQTHVQKLLQQKVPREWYEVKG